jgi:PsbP-like protein
MDNRNLIAALAVVALIIVAATAAGCTTNTTSSPTPTPIPATQTTAGNNTTFSSAAGFNITFPKSLKTDSSINGSQPIRLYIYTGNNGFDGIVVATNDLLPNSTLNDWAKYNKDNLKINATLENYKNFTVLNETNTTFAGKPAHTIVWSGTIPVAFSATNQKDMPVQVMQTFIVNDNMGYAITYKGSPASNYTKYLPQAQTIMKSFVLT